MLQPDHPEGYVIATGPQHAAREVGMDENGYVAAPLIPEAAWCRPEKSIASSLSTPATSAPPNSLREPDFVPARL